MVNEPQNGDVTPWYLTSNCGKSPSLATWKTHHFNGPLSIAITNDQRVSIDSGDSEKHLITLKTLFSHEEFVAPRTAALS